MTVPRSAVLAVGGGDCTTVRLIPLLSQDKEMYRNSDADTSNNLNNLDNLNMTEEREKKKTASYKQLWNTHLCKRG